MGEDDDDDDDGDDGSTEARKKEDRLKQLETRLAAMEEEREKMNSELWGLRDRVQELEWQNGQLERKLGEKAETGGKNGNDDGGERMKKIEERLERGEKDLREVVERFERGRPETVTATTSGSGSSNSSGSSSNNNNNHSNNNNNNYKQQTTKTSTATRAEYLRRP